MDVGCHVIDRIDYLCGRLVNINQDVEDYVELQAEIGQATSEVGSY
jgi:hypothetical protein